MAKNTLHIAVLALVVSSFALNVCAKVSLPKVPRVTSIGLPYVRKTKTRTELRDFNANTGLDGEGEVTLNDLRVEDPNPPYSPEFKSGMNRPSVAVEIRPKMTGELAPKMTGERLM